MHLKKRGVFLCRSLSFKQCTFDFIVQELEGTDFGRVYDEVYICIYLYILDYIILRTSPMRRDTHSSVLWPLAVSVLWSNDGPMKCSCCVW
jgi:hypothetical protein